MFQGERADYGRLPVLLASLAWQTRQRGFSALKIEDYKNILCLHINEKGDLTIYPIKIERVPREHEWIPRMEDKNEIKFYDPATEIQVG